MSVQTKHYDAKRRNHFHGGVKASKPHVLAMVLATAFSSGVLAQAPLAAGAAPAADGSPSDSRLAATTVSASALSDTAPASGGQIARGGRVGILGDKSAMETPFSVTSYTSERIENQQAVTLAEVLNSDPSVRFTGQIGGVTDSFFIRGFPINEGNLSEVAFGGVYGVSPNYHLFTEYIDRVEILRGPAALLYGMSPNGGVGGVVNIVPKRALAKDLTWVTVDYATKSQAGIAVDVSRRFGDERQWGIRFNGLRRQGSTALDNQSSRAEVGALSLDYRGTRLRASLDVIEQYQWVDAPTRPFLVAAGIQVPSAPSGARNVTQKWGWWKSNDISTLAHVEYDLSDNVTVFADAGTAKSDVARLSEPTPTILDTFGNTSATPQNWKFQVNRTTLDTGVRGTFHTGDVSHAVTVQANYYTDRVASGANAGMALLSNIYAPVDRPEQFIGAPTRVPLGSTSTLSGVALADTIGLFADRLQLTLGVRGQQVRSNNYNAVSGAVSTAYDKRAITPLAGILFKVTEDVSLYANYIEGLSKGDVAPTTASNAGEVFAPYKTKQKEVGVKVAMGGVIATLAAFEITKPSGSLSNSVFSVNSEQRNRGLELTMAGEPYAGLRLIGGLTWLNAQLTTTPNAATQGKRPVGVPQLMANAGVEWDVKWVPGMTLTGALTYTADEYVNQTNTQSVPSWTTVDLGVRYKTKLVGKSTTFRVGVNNVFDRHYWSGVASYGTLSLGAPRTLYASAAVDF